MIKFFRRIRHKLLGEGKVKNYLLYAIGEIVLVVVGILIALQLNNFNEAKKDQVKLFNLGAQKALDFLLQFDWEGYKVIREKLSH